MVLWQVLFWAVITIALIIFEFSTVQLVAVWFAAGGLAAFISSFFGVSFTGQLIIFIAGSLLLLAATRPLVHKLLKGKHAPTNSDRLIGTQCIVREEVNNLTESGRVFADGLSWSARSADDSQVYPEGTICIITAIKGVKVIVKAE